MKKTNTAFVFGALVVASFVAVRCGGDDSNTSATTTGTAPRVDGGARSREWNCTNVYVPPPREAGAAPDGGGRCPNGTNDGDPCTMAGTVCRNGNNSGCACITFGAETTWFCN